MSTKTTLALGAVLLLSWAPTTLAAHARRNAPGWSDGTSGDYVPGSAAEKAWFDRNTRSGGGF